MAIASPSVGKGPFVALVPTAKHIQFPLSLSVRVSVLSTAHSPKLVLLRMCRTTHLCQGLATFSDPLSINPHGNELCCSALYPSFPSSLPFSPSTAFPSRHLPESIPCKAIRTWPCAGFRAPPFSCKPHLRESAAHAVERDHPISDCDGFLTISFRRGITRGFLPILVAAIPQFYSRIFPHAP